MLATRLLRSSGRADAQERRGGVGLLSDAQARSPCCRVPDGFSAPLKMDVADRIALLYTDTRFDRAGLAPVYACHVMLGALDGRSCWPDLRLHRQELYFLSLHDQRHDQIL